MEQLRLPMLTVYEGPQLVPLEVVDACRTYRDAVRACWDRRSRRSLTQRAMAVETGLHAPHVSDYLSEEPDKRDLPAKYITEFQRSCGNLLITQWQARQDGVTIMEQFMQRRAA
jgi:hypothetical protein